MTHDATAQNQNSVDLDSIQIASPCTADWDAMDGDARRRFCGECSLHVHDLSAMTSDEAVAFLQQQSGRACVRMRRRADGRILTQDCPVGWAKVRAKARAVRRRTAVFAATLFGAVACGLRSTERESVENETGGSSAPPTPVSKPVPNPKPAPDIVPLMGEITLLGAIEFPQCESSDRIVSPELADPGEPNQPPQQASEQRD